MAIDPAKPFDLEYDVHENQHGMRLDRYVNFVVPTISRTRIQQYNKKGRILLNGENVTASTRVREGDHVVLKCQVPEGRIDIARDIPLDIIYEDEWLVAVNKQPGLVVHPVALHRHDTLLNAMFYRYENTLPPDRELSLANRIDKFTSGVILVTKDVEVKRHLQEQFEARTVQKTYRCIVHGHVQEDSGTVDLPIGPKLNRTNRCQMGIRTDAEGKPSQTNYTVLERLESADLGPFSLVRVAPKTGRQHQIRVHMAALGHPLAGEHMYGANEGIEWHPPVDEVGRLDRFALHAETLDVIHPKTEMELNLVAPLADDMEEFLHALRSGWPLTTYPFDNKVIPTSVLEEDDISEDEVDALRRFSHIPIGEHEFDQL